MGYAGFIDSLLAVLDSSGASPFEDDLSDENAILEFGMKAFTR